MRSHRFAVGEVVLCAERHRPYMTWRGPYRILTCIKAVTAEPQYRIVAIHRSVIRIAGEHELCRAPQPLRVSRPSPGWFLESRSHLPPANLNLRSEVKGHVHAHGPNTCPADAAGLVQRPSTGSYPAGANVP